MDNTRDPHCTARSPHTHLQSANRPCNCQVRMRILVAENGFNNFGSQDDPKTVIQDVTIHVEAVNDMPYLSWVHLPPKD